MEGKLFQLAITPGERLLGATVITPDGSLEGRYMRRPEGTYGSITIDGAPVASLAALCDAIMGSEYMVKWTSEVVVDFTKECPVKEKGEL